MTVDATLIVGTVTAIGTTMAAAYANRRHIDALRRWAWGEESDESDMGQAELTESIAEKIDRIEEKLDEEASRRQDEHTMVEDELRITRRLVVDSTKNLVESLNEEVPEADIEPTDVEPGWYDFVRDEDDAAFDGGQRVE